MARVALICISLRAGGTERIVSRLANFLAQKHEVGVVLLASAQPFYVLCPQVRIMQPEVQRRTEAGVLWYPRIIQHLWRSLRSFKPDLVMSFGEPIAPLIIPFSRLLGVQVVAFNRASPLTSLVGARGILNPLVYPFAAYAVVQTEASVKALKRRYRKTQFQVIPNPIDIPAKCLEWSSRRLRILTVGSLGGRKNQQAVVRAFASLSGIDEWSLDIVGEGPEKANLERLVSELGVADRVNLLGQRSDVGILMMKSRVFAFASLSEGFPNALAEALAAGCACVSYDCPTGPSDLIEHGYNGLLVPNDDEAAFAQQLERLVADEALQVRLSRQARKEIERFSEDRVLEQFDRLIAETLGHDSHSTTEPCDS